MFVKYEHEIAAEPVADQNTSGVRKAVLIGPDEGAPNFIMRRFDLEAGGYTPYHTHNWEHVVYILRGSGTLKGEIGEYKLTPGAAVLVLPNEEHQFIAADNAPLSFLCSIPKQGV